MLSAAAKVPWGLRPWCNAQEKRRSSKQPCKHMTTLDVINNWCLVDLRVDCYLTKTNHRNKSDQNRTQVISKSLSIEKKLFFPLQSMEENGKALSRLLLEVLGDLQQCQKIWNRFFIR